MTTASLPDEATLRENGYRVEQLNSGTGPVKDAWVLCAPDGSHLMIGNHGCVSPTRWEAVAEGIRRIKEEEQGHMPIKTISPAAPEPGQLIATRIEPPHRKTWEEVTDEEIIEAVRLCQEKRGSKGVAQAGMVSMMLSNPKPEDWHTQPCPENAATGMGLIPRWGEGMASPGKVAARLRKMAKAGLLERVEMVRPRGKPASPGYRVAQTPLERRS